MEPTVKTDYSDRANLRRGYHDMIDTVTFPPDWDFEHQECWMLEQYNRRFASSMWCGLPVYVGDNIWTISHGYDSGD